MTIVEEQYPETILDHPHLRIVGYNYKMPTVDDYTSGTGFGAGGTTDPENIKMEEDDQVCEISLYIPGKFGDSATASWNDTGVVTLGSPRSVLEDFNRMKNSSGTLDTITNFGKMIIPANFAKSAGSALLNSIGNNATIGNVDLKKSAFANVGHTLRPNRMKVYEGSSNLTLPLNYEFAPKNESELKAMIKIIDFFRSASRANLTAGSLLYKFPPLFTITVVKPGGVSVSSDSFLQYRVMALTSFAVTYGNYNNTMNYFDIESLGDEYKFAPTDANLTLTFESLFPTHNVTDTSPSGYNLKNEGEEVE